MNPDWEEPTTMTIKEIEKIIGHPFTIIEEEVSEDEWSIIIRRMETRQSGSNHPVEREIDEEYSNEGQLTLLSKEIYWAEADEDMSAFEYRYIIKAMDCRRLDQMRKQFVSAYICVHYVNTGNQNH